MTATAQRGAAVEAKSDRAVRALEGMSKGLSLAQLGSMFRRGLDIGGSDLGGPQNPYRQALWVYRSVFVLATTAGGVPLRLSRGEAAGTRAIMGRKHCRQGLASARRAPLRGEKAVLRAAPGDIVEGGPLWSLLARPGAGDAWETTWGRLVKRTVALMMLPPGRCLWHLADLVGRRPRAIRVIPGEWTRAITPSGNPQDEVIGWQVRTPWGNHYRLLPEEVICWANLNPYEPHLGMSPAEPARLAIASDYNASLYNAAMFGNSAEPGGVLETDAPYNPELDEQLRMAWMQRHQGAARAKALAVTWGGLHYKTIASSMAEMQYDAGKRLVRTEEVGAFGVSEVVAGFYSDANYQFAEQGREQFWQDTMMPLLDDVAEAVQIHLVPRFDEDLEAWFDLEDVPIIQKMRAVRTPIAKAFFDMGYPPNRINDLLDLGMPDLPWGETGYLSAGLLPANAVAEATLFSPTPEGTGDGNAELGTRNAERTAKTETGKQKTERERLARIAGRIWAAFGAEYESLARRGQGLLRIHFARQQTAVVKRLEEALLSGGYAPIKSAIRNPQSAIEKSEWEPVMERVLVDVFRDPKEREVFRARLRTLVADGTKTGLRQALAEAGLSGDALDQALKRLTSLPAIQQSLASEAVMISSRIDLRTRTMLRASLAEGLREGETIRELATRVQTFMGNRRASAVVVARNAIGQTLSRARHEGHKATGMTHRIWIHSRGPGERRPAHVAAEGYYTEHPVGMDEPFMINGVRLMYPRDFSCGHMEEVMNCQCAAIAKRAEAGEEPTAAGILEYHQQRLEARGLRPEDGEEPQASSLQPQVSKKGDGDADADEGA